MAVKGSRWRALVAAPVAAVLAGAFAPDQTRTLDEGVYRIAVGGREVGRETFAIRQSGTGPGAVIIAQGRVAVDAGAAPRELSSTLQVTGPAFRPTAYEVAIRRPQPRTIAGRVVGNRFSARIVSPEGERMREYLVTDGALLIDEGIVHHYYFLGQRFAQAGRTVPVLVPQQNLQRTAQVELRGTETVRLNGETRTAQLLVVSSQCEDPAHVWVDDQGRVLRFAVPARDLVAERAAPPR